MSCVFCNIVNRTSPAHVIWESDSHISFLSIFPNTEGFSVVIPKKHYSSYAFDQEDNVLFELMVAAKKTARLIDRALPGVARTGLILEGYGVDHLHAKLFPMHGTGNSSEFKKTTSSYDKFFDKYEGYISSHDYRRASDEALARLAEHIRRYR